MRKISESVWDEKNCLKMNQTFMQCNQMATFFVQYLAIYNNENLPSSIRKLPKLDQYYAKYQINPHKIFKDF